MVDRSLDAEGRLRFEGRSGYAFYPNERGAAPIERRRARDLTEAHVENFLDCCVSGARPNGDVEVGHRSAMTSHLGNIAYLEKRRVVLDPLDDEILPG